jgi:hypothetical protein
VFVTKRIYRLNLKYAKNFFAPHPLFLLPRRRTVLQLTSQLFNFHMICNVCINKFQPLFYLLNLLNRQGLCFAFSCPLERYKRVRWLYNRRFPQLNILFLHAARNFSAYIICNQITNGAGEIKIYRVNIFCNKTVLQCPVNRFTNDGGFFC